MSEPLFESRLVDDVDDMFPAGLGWDHEVTQMTCGALGYRESVLSLPGLDLTWESCRQQIRSYQWMQKPGFYFGIPGPGGRPPIWKGRGMGPGQILIFGNREQDLILHPGCEILSFYVRPEIAEPLGLTRLESGLWDCHPERLRRFTQICQIEGRRLAQSGQSPSDRTRRATRLDSWILRTLPLVLARPSGEGPGEGYRIVRRAEDILEREGWYHPYQIDEMAEALCVPRRTLHRAFKEWSGLGPKAYMRIAQLHHFRRQLKQNPQKLSVTAAASEAGFEHLGRAARYYQDLFGELPRETLQRQDLAS